MSDEPAEEPIDLVATVGALDPTVVLLREFVHRSGAIRAVAVVALEDAMASVDVSRLEPIEVIVGERRVHLPHSIELPDAIAIRIPEVRQLPAFEVKADQGEIAAPLGGIEHYARAVRDLAAILGEENIAVVTWETSDPDAPFSVSARADEPIVLALGDEPFEQEPGWPEEVPTSRRRGDAV